MYLLGLEWENNNTSIGNMLAAKNITARAIDDHMGG
jgi:hypothetical protein